MAELIWSEEEVQHMDSLKELGLQKLTLDINRRIEPKFAKENDTKSRGLDIQVKKDNKIIDTTGVILKMYAMPVRGQEVYEIESSAVDASRGKYRIIYPTVILQAGTTLAEIVLLKDEQVISSKKFKIEIESRLLTDDVVKGHDAYPLFEQLLKAAKTIEGVDIAAEEERKKNEVIRQSQEQQRQESMTDIEYRFNLLETSKQQDVEVINARTSTVKNKTFDSLNDRLEETEKEIDKSLYSTPVEFYNNIVSLPENTIGGQISLNIFGNTEANEEGGTKSTIAAMQIKSVGKNLFSTTMEKGTINAQGNDQNNPVVVRTKGFIKVEPSTRYFLSNFNIGNIYLKYYDENKNYLLDSPSFSLSTNNFTTSTNCHYLRFARTGNTDLSIKYMLNKGDTVTEYEPYKESTAYVVAKDKDNKIVNLNRLSNGVYDEIDLDEGKVIKRTKEIFLDGSENWGLQREDLEKVYVFGLALDEAKSMANGFLILNDNNFSLIQNWHLDEEHFYITSGDMLVVHVTKTIIDAQEGDNTTAKFKNWLKEGNLIYELAEPYEIDIDIKPIQGYENGTLIIEPYIKEKFIVDNSKTINLQYPIKSIDKLLKLDTDGIKWTETKGTLSEDGQTITVTEKGTYEVYGEIREGYSANPQTTLIAPVNLNAQINSNTDAIKKIGDKVYTDADLFTAMLLQQEVRITALEGGMTV